MATKKIRKTSKRAKQTGLAPLPERFLADLMELAKNPDNLTGLNEHITNVIALLQKPAILREAQVLLTSRSEKNVINVAQDLLDRAGQKAPEKVDLRGIFGEISPELIRQALIEQFKGAEDGC